MYLLYMHHCRKNNFYHISTYCMLSVIPIYLAAFSSLPLLVSSLCSY